MTEQKPGQQKIIIPVIGVMVIGALAIGAYKLYDTMSNPSESAARKELQHIAVYKNLEVTDFIKTNGIMSETNGVKHYMMFCRATAIANKNYDLMTGNVKTHKVSRGRFDSGASVLDAVEVTEVKKGDHFACQGKVDFIKSEKGWTPFPDCDFFLDIPIQTNVWKKPGEVHKY